jgi:contractile injection system tape measure protein
LHISCRAGAGEQAEGLAVRRRLEAVARTALPAALDRRASGWRDRRLAGVAVRLDFDPRDHDDATVALLWADRIGAAVERTAPLTTPSVPPSAHEGVEPASVDDGDRVATATGRAAAAAARALVASALRGDAGALVRLTAALAEPGQRAPLLEALAPDEALGLADGLEALAAVAAAATEAGEPVGAAPAAEVAERAARREPAGRAPSDDERRHLRAAATLLLGGAGAPAAPAAAAGAAPSSSLLRTSCAGLVLAYPWLGALLADAVAARPTLDPVAARRLALAAIAGERHDAAPPADDPLVRLLAGDDSSAAPAALAADPEPAQAAGAAAQLLGDLAAALPGFGASPPDYVRRELIVRAGTIDLAGDPIPVTLAPAPLDVVLAFLPYPLGIFRLGWTPPMTIRLRAP